MARPQHIVTETEDYFIDLVFYNIELKCYVLVDLKMGKITHPATDELWGKYLYRYFVANFPKYIGQQMYQGSVSSNKR